MATFSGGEIFNDVGTVSVSGQTGNVNTVHYTVPTGRYALVNVRSYEIDITQANRQGEIEIGSAVVGESNSGFAINYQYNTLTDFATIGIWINEGEVIRTITNGSPTNSVIDLELAYKEFIKP